jgi:hypothetical protein
MDRLPDALTLDSPTSEMLGDLEERIQRRLNGRVNHLQLSLRDDGLLLRGRANSYYVKQLAQHALMEAVKLPIGANEIEVV